MRKLVCLVPYAMKKGFGFNSFFTCITDKYRLRKRNFPLIKLFSAACIALSLVLAATGCAQKDRETSGTRVETTGSQGGTIQTKSSTAETTQAGSDTAAVPPGQSGGTVANPKIEKEELLQSASIDLDADGKNEEVEVLQAEAEDPAQPGVKELEGVLRISGINGRTDTVFIKKPDGVTGVMNAMEFSDLDGDGAKDVFITIPDAGASFSLNYYFIYSYKNGKAYKFNIDAPLSDFAAGFLFTYRGGGKLQIRNDGYGFSADFDITGQINGNGPDDEINPEYERAWVDASPVVISEESKIALKRSAGGTEIKVPLPVFGLAAADMIGEVDMYFTVGDDFTPVMKRFEVMDFNDGGALKKIGEWKAS